MCIRQRPLGDVSKLDPLHLHVVRMPEKGKFTILYGSQTGQAKAIAEEIHQRCTDHNLTASIFCLSLTDKKVSRAQDWLIGKRRWCYCYYATHDNIHD